MTRARNIFFAVVFIAAFVFGFCFWPELCVLRAFLFGGDSPAGYFGGGYDGNNYGNR